jgi:hypothetical protein
MPCPLCPPISHINLRLASLPPALFPPPKTHIRTGWVAYLGAANAGIPLSIIVKDYGWGAYFTGALRCRAAARRPAHRCARVPGQPAPVQLFMLTALVRQLRPC